VRAFSEGRLEPARVRQIGFGEATSSPLLVERTKAEVAGGLVPLLVPLLLRPPPMAPIPVTLLLRMQKECFARCCRQSRQCSWQPSQQGLHGG
jgi:hypothetical protein